MAEKPPSNSALPHLEMGGRASTSSYTHPRGGGSKRFTTFDRDPATQGARLRSQLSQARKNFEEKDWWATTESEVAEFGLLLDVESTPGFELKVESLERERSGIILLNVRRRKTQEGQPYTAAAIFVPYGKLHLLENQIRKYEETEEGKAPKHKNLLSNIENIRLAALEALWTEDEDLPAASSSSFWEVWIRRSENCEENFESECRRLNLSLSGRIVLPEHIVRLVRASRSQLESSVVILNSLSEVRRPRICSAHFTQMVNIEQRKHLQRALTRISWPEQNAAAVCILDTGINRGHPLLGPLLAETDMFTIHPESGTEDHPNEPHGTQMGGMAAFGHLVNLLNADVPWKQSHRLESVKILKNVEVNDPELYGDLTRQAVAMPETQTQRHRVYCLAVTAEPSRFDGSPTSWSAAIDSISSGYDGIEGNSASQGYVFLIAAGNWSDFINGYLYPETLHNNALFDPAQSWNAISVGANTQFVTIQEEGDDAGTASSIAPAGCLSPTSRTSLSWENQWPYKPDIVYEGGNYALKKDGEIWPPDSLRLLTTNSKFNTAAFTTFGDTSAATAQAARLGAILRARYPHYWAETIRGLIIHSARWNDGMLDGVDPHEQGQQEKIRKVLRLYGYGRPDENRAQYSIANDATIVCENTITPFTQRTSEAGAKKITTKELHIHNIPLPKDLLSEAGSSEATMRVTLSYFISPNPGSRAVAKAHQTRNRYRYAGAALRFEVKPPTMRESVFQSKLNAEVAAEDSDLEGEGFSDGRWAIGTKSRRIGGSVHHDIWRGPAADLALMSQIAVIPIKGWWATRKFPLNHECHNCHNRTIRYSLIVSVEVASDIPLYSEIQNLLTIPLEVET